MAFRGTFDYTLDAKNRLTIPAKFRATFAGGVVLALRHDSSECLSVWRPQDYESYTEQAFATYHPFSHQGAELKRFFFANSHDTELDAAGRVMVPAKMLEQTRLDKDVVVTGAGDCLEVWGRDAWNEHNATLATTVADITAQLGHPA